MKHSQTTQHSCTKMITTALIFLSTLAIGTVGILAATEFKTPSALDAIKSGPAQNKISSGNWDGFVSYVQTLGSGIDALSGLWLKTGTNAIYYATGNVGIGGAPRADFKLDILGGNIRIVNNSQGKWQGSNLTLDHEVAGVPEVERASIGLSNETKASFIISAKRDKNKLPNDMPILLNPFPTSSSGGKVGIWTTTPQAVLDVNGDLKVGTTTATCATNNEGTIKYTKGKGLEYCDGTTWQLLSAGTSPGSSAGGGNVPAGAVLAFDLATCPTGWTRFTGADNRFIMGSTTNSRETGGNSGVMLTIKNIPDHAHRFADTIFSEGFDNGGYIGTYPRRVIVDKTSGKGWVGSETKYDEDNYLYVALRKTASGIVSGSSKVQNGVHVIDNESKAHSYQEGIDYGREVGMQEKINVQNPYIKLIYCKKN